MLRSGKQDMTMGPWSLIKLVCVLVDQLLLVVFKDTLLILLELLDQR